MVKQVITNERCADIISSIVYLSQSLHFIIVAEYVETQMQRDRLIEIGCTCFQGYLYSKPLPFLEFYEKLKQLEENINCCLAKKDKGQVLS